MKNVLIDTNIILDFLMKREGFFEDARNVLALGYNKCYTLYLSSLSFSNIAYIIRKTKRFAIPERAVYFLKTKRTAGGTPPPQNIFDRLTPVFT